MIAADQTQSWIDGHSLLASAPAWLNKQRSDALTQFEALGLPGVRDEQWRYTNLRALKSNAYQPTERTSLDVELPASSSARLVIVDGYVDAQASNLDGVDFTYGSLADMLDNTDVQAAFGTTLPVKQHGFMALNTAYASDGYVLILPPKQVFKGHLEVVFVSQASDAVSHVRNVIIAGAHSQCTVIERHISAAGNPAQLSNVITEIVAADNAHVDHYKIQQLGDAAFHIGGVFVNHASNAHVKSHNIALGGRIVRNDVHSNLLGQGAHIEMNGLVVGSGTQHVDNHTQVNHLVPHCTSDEYYKTILDDQSRSVFRGRIVVAQDAQQTNADQQNNNLLLSAQAEADCKPQLEIYADDVKCSHGATVGQLDPKSVFYLKSRGINAEQANALLTFAFANEVIERVQVESIRTELTQLIAGELLSGLADLV
ncbi:Fe-S cluster assembly protein SufD [Arenicella chitinivorans]|uniref:Fe-S cluster assembly protein SufD n=1 Tax=Arenicella chitinivorans TaxID=1329800 RepID=A0A918S0N4_9GAMM|nr:Fe-S cluster assembly protein SufD [Arenicella chitinivorans]GHA18426.1 Fe-S cluster assembly protein SufD [Arenicella chitinivorans]